MAGNETAYTAKSVTTNKATLSGTVGISGNTVFDETLTADVSGLTSTPTIPALGTLTYQWKRGTINSGANSPTYRLVQADIGSTITVTVTAANCSGSIVSAATATISKATQTAPAAPTMASRTTTSITLNEITGCEYRIDGGQWQTSTTFNGLTPSTSYNFEAYKPETTTHSASAPSPTAKISTETAPQVTAVIISPNTATVPLGQTKQFTVQVIATGGADETVTWSISNQTSMLTTISTSGLLTVGSNETAATLKVKAVSNFNPAVSDEVTVTITTTGIDETALSGISIYPNPVKDELRIKSEELRINSVEICDVAGRVVETRLIASLHEGTATINVSTLPQGVYLVKIHTDKGVVTQKVVKN